MQKMHSLFQYYSMLHFYGLFRFEEDKEGYSTLYGCHTWEKASHVVSSFLSEGSEEEKKIRLAFKHVKLWHCLFKDSPILSYLSYTNPHIHTTLWIDDSKKLQTAKEFFSLRFLGEHFHHIFDSIYSEIFSLVHDDDPQPSSDLLESLAKKCQESKVLSWLIFHPVLGHSIDFCIEDDLSDLIGFYHNDWNDNFYLQTTDPSQMSNETSTISELSHKKPRKVTVTIIRKAKK